MEFEKTSNNKLGYVIIVIIIGVVGFFWLSSTNETQYVGTNDFSSYTTEKRDTWDLSLYSSESPNTDYLVDKIKGFASQSSCVDEGVSRRLSGGSFECGYKCKTQYSTLKGFRDQYDICERVCDDGGCRE